jgi:exopolyphosphatase/pppGpp-phosphohydrolase
MTVMDKDAKDRIGLDEEHLEAVLRLAEACHYEADHARNVTELALCLFDQLRELHGLGREERIWLACAGLLHDIGWIEGQRGHHKVAGDLIAEATYLPFDDLRRLILANVARYHRKALPSTRHARFAALSDDDRRRVCLLAGVLRLADGLDFSHRGLVRDVTCRVESGVLTVCVRTDVPPEEDLRAGRKKSDLLAEALGLRVEIGWETAEPHAE